MVSTYTVNLGLEEPARGDQVGIWDTPENANAAILDLVVGGTTNIGLLNSSVTLSAAQYQCRRIVFTGALTSSVLIIFPTGFRKSYEVENLCTNVNLYTVYLLTGVVGGEYIAAPPGEIVDVFNDSVNLRYKNFGRIGEYMDFAGTSSPAWIASGAGFYGVGGVPLWLNCDGSAFSAVTYPVLANVLGGTTLPDSRGRVRAALNQTTGRLTAAGGVNGDIKLQNGGLEYNILAAAQIPTITATNASVQFLSNITTLVRAVGGFAFQRLTGAYPQRAIVNGGQATGQPTISGTLGINSNNTGSAFHTNTQPTYIGGVTLIRAK